MKYRQAPSTISPLFFIAYPQTQAHRSFCARPARWCHYARTFQPMFDCPSRSPSAPQVTNPKPAPPAAHKIHPESCVPVAQAHDFASIAPTLHRESTNMCNKRSAHHHCPPRLHQPPHTQNTGMHLAFPWVFALLPNPTTNTPRRCGSSGHPTRVFNAFSSTPMRSHRVFHSARSRPPRAHPSASSHLHPRA
jgi:hypothetical protein